MLLSTVFALGATLALAADESDVLPKQNAEFEKWGEESGWNIFVDKSRDTCLIERVDENKNVVQMGLTKDKEFGYIGVFTLADVDLSDNRVHLSLDGKRYWGDATVAPKRLVGGYKGGYLLANNPDFVDDIMKKYVMTVEPEDKNAYDVSLDGTFKAIEKARECNAAVGS
jgi:hypothetical protein